MTSTTEGVRKYLNEFYALSSDVKPDEVKGKHVHIQNIVAG